MNDLKKMKKKNNKILKVEYKLDNINLLDQHLIKQNTELILYELKNIKLMNIYKESYKLGIIDKKTYKEFLNKKIKKLDDEII